MRALGPALWRWAAPHASQAALDRLQGGLGLDPAFSSVLSATSPNPPGLTFTAFLRLAPLSVQVPSTWPSQNTRPLPILCLTWSSPSLEVSLLRTRRSVGNLLPRETCELSSVPPSP